jgi:hypothetical protein
MDDEAPIVGGTKMPRNGFWSAFARATASARVRENSSSRDTAL